MGAGRGGAAGAVGATAGPAEGERAAARCRCLEDATAAETTGRRRRNPAMVETAVQVRYTTISLSSELISAFQTSLITLAVMRGMTKEFSLMV